MPAFASYQLGRLPHDPARLAKAPSLLAHPLAAQKAPAQLDRSKLPYQPGLYQNDDFPDCTAAAMANSASLIAALNGYDLKIDPVKVLAFFAACVGLPDDPAQLALSDGAVLLDVMARQASQGFDIGPQLLVGGFVSVPQDQREVLANCMARFGAGNWGVALSVSDQNMPIWDTIAPASAGDPSPASWGRHNLVGVDYTGLGDTDLVSLATWGGIQKATWRWVLARVEEAYAVIWRQLAKADTHFWTGLNYDQMMAESAAFADA